MDRKFYKLSLGVLLVIIGLVFINSYFLESPLQNFFYKSTNKTDSFFSSKIFSFARYSSWFLDTKALINENSNLNQQKNVFLGQIAELDALKKENQFLRNELGLSKSLGAKLLLAQIFNVQRGAATSTALINKGSDDGVKKDFAVVASGNVLVGIVKEVFDKSALIILTDDPRVKISAKIQGSSTLVNTRGTLRDSLTLDLVANGDNIKEGDLVVTSGLDVLPESLPIAQITKVESANGALFKKVNAKPLFDLGLGSNLFVLIK